METLAATGIALYILYLIIFFLALAIVGGLIKLFAYVFFYRGSVTQQVDQRMAQREEDRLAERRGW